MLSSFYTSIAGMREGLNLLNRAAGLAENPDTFRSGAPTSFQEILAREQSSAQVLAPVNSGSLDQDPHARPGFPPLSQIPLPPAPLSSLLISRQPDLLNVMTDMLVAKWVFETNAKLVTASSRVLETLVHLGE